MLRERLKAGESDAEIRGFLASRYGEFVLLEPHLSAYTVMLWALPALGLALGGITFLLASRCKNRIDENTLSLEENSDWRGFSAPTLKKCNLPATAL